MKEQELVLFHLWCLLALTDALTRQQIKAVLCGMVNMLKNTFQFSEQRANKERALFGGEQARTAKLV